MSVYINVKNNIKSTRKSLYAFKEILKKYLVIDNSLNFSSWSNNPCILEHLPSVICYLRYSNS